MSQSEEYKDSRYSDAASSNNEVEEYQGFDDAADKSIRELARTITNTSINMSKTKSSEDLIRYLSHMSQVPGVEPYNHEEIEESLNPESDMFNAKFWVKNVRKLLDSDPDYYKPTSLGVAYRDLRAYGIATDSDYQPTVTSALFKLGKDYIRSLRKQDTLIS